MNSKSKDLIRCDINEICNKLFDALFDTHSIYINANTSIMTISDDLIVVLNLIETIVNDINSYTHYGFIQENKLCLCQLFSYYYNYGLIEGARPFSRIADFLFKLCLPNVISKTLELDINQRILITEKLNFTLCTTFVNCFNNEKIIIGFVN